MQFEFAADFLEPLLEKWQREGLHTVLVDPAPCHVHMLVAVVFVSMECDRAGLATQSKHPLNSVSGIFKLLTGECLTFAVSYLNMEERFFAFRGGGHDLHVAKSVLDVVCRETAELPQFGALSVLA